MRRFLCIPILAAALALAGCGGWVPTAVEAYGKASTTTIDTKALKQGAFTAYAVYTQAVEGASAYASLPRCTAARTAACSSQAVVNEMRRLDTEAYPYVDRAATLAREAAPSVTLLQVAVKAAQEAANRFGGYVTSNKVN